MPVKDKEYQRGLIITDDIAKEPILDFNLYTNAIVKIIKDSYPKFTIGLFGDWGTGKTTLMNSIKNDLEQDKENIITVWFDAWRYENEKQFALIPLLKTINYSINDEKDEKKRNLKEALKEAAIFTLGISQDILSSIVTNYAGKEVGGLFKKSLDGVTSKLIPQLKSLKELSEADRNSIFYRGIDNIQDALDAIRDKRDFRVVIFIDDLDRCSPSKTLEVLESMKIFLSLDGIIYILGLSRDIVTKLIEIKYQETGVNGEEYIKKMIQIPITLPKWDNKDIIELVEDFMEKKLIHEEIKGTIEPNLISIAVENNPREVKRFLNNFIIAYEIFHSIKNFKANELLLIQAIQLRWNKFYDLLMRTDREFRIELDKYARMDDDERLKTLESQELGEDEGRATVTKEEEKKQILGIRKLLSNYKTNIELWTFLRNYSNTLSNIIDITIYRRSVEVGIEPTAPTTDKNQEAYALLKGGDITTFNERITEFRDLYLEWAELRGARLKGAKLAGADLRMANLAAADLSKSNLREAELGGAKLSGAKLSGAKLEGANLRNSDLTRADLREAELGGAALDSAILEGANLGGAQLGGMAKLRGANLRGAKLGGAQLLEADLSGADLREADLSGADLREAKFVGAELEWTKLVGAKLAGADLRMANLGGADLSQSIIISPDFEDLRLNESTIFDSAIIDDSKFVDYIRQFTQHVPEKIRNKKELKVRLSEIASEERLIADVLSRSKLLE